jgi:hypothetical protein
MSGPSVRIQSDVRFGRPHLHGISTESIADMYWVGEDVEDDYELTRHELLVVLWFEATQGQPRFRRRWKAWTARVGGSLWRGSTLDQAAIELPPARNGR